MFSRCTLQIHYKQLTQEEMSADIIIIADYYFSVEDHEQSQVKELIIWENWSAKVYPSIVRTHGHFLSSLICDLEICLLAAFADINVTLLMLEIDSFCIDERGVQQFTHRFSHLNIDLIICHDVISRPQNPNYVNYDRGKQFALFNLSKLVSNIAL